MNSRIRGAEFRREFKRRLAENKDYQLKSKIEIFKLEKQFIILKSQQNTSKYQFELKKFDEKLSKIYHGIKRWQDTLVKLNRALSNIIEQQDEFNHLLSPTYNE